MTREQLENIIKNAEEDKMLAEERMQNIKKEQDKRIADAKMQLKNMSSGYERRKNGEKYWFVNEDFEADCWGDTYNIAESQHYQNGNYMSRENAERMAKKVKLMFLLDRFSRENGWDDRLWESNQKSKWYYTVSTKSKEIIIFSTDYYKEPCKVYFETEEICEQAIEKYHDLILETMQEQKVVEKKPTKTYLDDLLEKYPNIMVNSDGIPRGICLRNLGSKIITNCNAGGNYGGNCIACWNQEMEEM